MGSVNYRKMKEDDKVSRAKNPKYESMSLEELKANMEKKQTGTGGGSQTTYRKGVKTGDDTPIALYILLLAAATCAAGGAAAAGRKKKQ